MNDGQPTPSRPLLVAHRAGNSAEHLRTATDIGVDLIEADVWPYRGRLEVRHLKTMGPVPLLWDKWALVSARAPRLLLHDMLAGVGPGTRLMLDLKGGDERPARTVADTMSREMEGRAYTVCSRSWHLLDAFRDQPHVHVVHSIGTERELRAARRLLPDRPGDGISVQRRLLNAERVEALRRLAPVVMTWPINTRAHLRQVLDWGVNGVISDELELLRWMAGGR